MNTTFILVFQTFIHFSLLISKIYLKPSPGYHQNVDRCEIESSIEQLSFENFQRIMDSSFSYMRCLKRHKLHMIDSKCPKYDVKKI